MNSNSWRKEIHYLLSQLVENITDIFLWCELHENVFPNLANMAQDILSIVSTSVPSERLFLY